MVYVSHNWIHHGLAKVQIQALCTIIVWNVSLIFKASLSKQLNLHFRFYQDERYGYLRVCTPRLDNILPPYKILAMTATHLAYRVAFSLVEKTKPKLWMTQNSVTGFTQHMLHIYANLTFFYNFFWERDFMFFEFWISHKYISIIYLLQLYY